MALVLEEVHCLRLKFLCNTGGKQASGLGPQQKDGRVTRIMHDAFLPLCLASIASATARLTVDSSCCWRLAICAVSLSSCADVLAWVAASSASAATDRVTPKKANCD